MDNLASYSSENINKIKIVLELLINALELKDPLDKFVLKIPHYDFKKNYIEYNEALRILTLISQGGSLFTVLNDKHKRLLRESEPYMSGWEAKNKELRNAYYKLGITQEDLKKYFLIEIKDSDIVNKLNQFKRGNTNTLASSENSDQILDLISNKNKLLDEIPQGKKYRPLRKITQEFIKNDRVDNWKLMACIAPTIKGRKFSKKDYITDHYYNIKNRSITVKKYWNRSNFTIKVRKNFSEILPI